MWRLIGDSQGWLYSAKELTTSEIDTTHYWSADWNLRPSSPVCRHLSSQNFALITLRRLLPFRFQKTDFCLSFKSCMVSVLTFYRSTCLGPGKFSVQDLHCPEYVHLI